MNLISKQAVPWIKNLEPYNGGKPIQELAKILNVSEDKIVKLASNENPLGISPKVKLKINHELSKINRYPDGNCTILKNAISDLHGISCDQIFLGNGSNDVLECLAKTFLREGISAMYSKHSFAVYSLATISSGANSIVVPSTENLGHDLTAFLSFISSDTRLIFIANPNNPTGSFICQKKIRSFLDLVDKSILVVLDEAYFEYLEGVDRSSSIELLKDFSNLFITRSFSKAYGLAGLRVGYGLGSEEVIRVMNSVRQPFNVNSLAQIAALSALEDQDFVEKSCLTNRKVMTELVNGLSSFGINCLSSKGNFVLANIGNNVNSNTHSAGLQLFESLLSLGVITRPVQNYDLPDWLRISVGTEEENRYFLRVLPQALEFVMGNVNIKKYSS
jgi:histidinol-phosphate aminotransferase